ncbi:hypothetical protein KI387_032738 [Taxus chinensis]|uniref:TIR domain-containing protein n=1 Tax=Taxus chinensis TaxID=29808 RepID=A0AA38BQU3_TAXCH|nr:hypothetical protein KI387_032738 [Taxus chinensis]
MSESVLFSIFLSIFLLLALHWCFKVQKKKYSHHRSAEYDVLNVIQPLGELRRSSASPRLFDVFINHRGPDVKQTLALQLYNSLEELGFQAFLDSSEMELGDSFPFAIRNAICSATVHIAIFSKRYAESAWCLHELALMLQTKTKIIPVFYGVKPSDLRFIEKGVYANAFARYRENGRFLDKLEEWKIALRSVSFYNGYEFAKHNHDQDKLCKTVVSAVVKEVENTRCLHVAENPVGLDEVVQHFERRCSQEMERKTKSVGIYGMGGSGKTTLAIELFNRKRCEYDGSCFLSGVREAYDKNDLPILQTKLVKDLFHHRDPPQFQSTLDGKSYLKSSLRRTNFLRFLIVLDDIDHKDQIDALLDTKALNSESLVIVTTRDERVLVRSGITLRYQMKEMNPEHSRQLFCWHALHQPYPTNGYEDLVEMFVKECGGLPLSLQVLGGHVFGTTDHHYWQSVLDEVRKTLPHEIRQKIKISFDALSYEQKQIFMDIACFFIGKPKSMAIRIWKALGWSGELGLQTLKDKCLVEVVWSHREEFDDDKLVFRMQNHLHDLGREMADNLSPPHRWWRPEYLKTLELKCFEKILTNSNGRGLLSIFDSSTGVQITCFIGNPNNYTERSVSLLWLQLNLNGCKHSSIPSWIPLQNVRYLRIVDGRLTRLWQKHAQAPSQLTELVLDKISLEESTNSLGMLNNVEKLALRGRYEDDDGKLFEGISLSKSLRKLTRLRSLAVRHFSLCGIVALDSSVESTTLESPMSSLEKIDISEEKHVWKVSISGDHCPSLKSLRLESIENLIYVSLSGVTTLDCLQLRSCRELVTVSGIRDLAKLVTLNIRECPKVTNFLSLASLSCLERITIDGCQKLQNITGIEQLQRLKYLHLSAEPRLIWNCISRLQRMPSVLTTVIGRAVYGATSSLTENLFSSLIGANAASEIHINQNGMPEVTLNSIPKSISAIIVCAVVQSNYGEIIQIPLPSSDSIESYIGEGEWIVTVVFNIKSDWIPSVLFGAEITKGCIVKVNSDEEEETMPIFKRIIDQLYQKPIMLSQWPWLTGENAEEVWLM